MGPVPSALFCRTEGLFARREAALCGVPARTEDFQRFRLDAFRQGEGGHHRPGPVPWRGTGPRALFLGAGWGANSEIVAEHLQGVGDGRGLCAAEKRQSAGLG